MKLRFVYSLFTAVVVFTLLTSNSGGRATSQNKGNTGAPGDETVGGTPRVCASCHGGGAFAANVVLEVFETGTTTPVTAYTPGTTYDVRVTVNHTGSPVEYGFQALALKNTGNSPVNTWAESSPSVQLKTITATGRQYAEHTSGVTTNVFNMQWTAPAAGSGSVTFYVGGNACNGNNMDSGDSADTFTLTLTEATNTGIPVVDQLPVSLELFPNPVQDETRIKATNLPEGDYVVEVSDMTGRIVSSLATTANVLHNGLNLTLAGLSAGNYAATVKGNGVVKTTRIYKN